MRVLMKYFFKSCEYLRLLFKIRSIRMLSLNKKTIRYWKSNCFSGLKSRTIKCYLLLPRVNRTTLKSSCDYFTSHCVWKVYWYIFEFLIGLGVSGHIVTVLTSFRRYPIHFPSWPLNEFEFWIVLEFLMPFSLFYLCSIRRNST